MPVAPKYLPAPHHQELGTEFYDPVKPAEFPKALLRYRNQDWAERVGLGSLTAEEWEDHFARFMPLPDNYAKPLALRYHGHQFRTYNPDLGDGRGFLFAQFVDPVDGRLLDLGTKGSGQTPWSRDGDGRLTLKGAVREALATEMLEALGVYTSKTFSIFETGENLVRHDEPSPTRSGVLVRLNHSHIRFGTFQRFAFLQEKENIQKLFDYTIHYYFPEIEKQSASERPMAFLREVSRRSAELCASWMMAGFVHGVLNTDNMNVTGESFDYGPYRFLPTYNPEFIAAYFDHYGLYAYGRQPNTVLWNIERLVECLAMVAELEPLMACLDSYAMDFSHTIGRKFLERMGIQSMGQQRDNELFIRVFTFMQASQIGFEQFFFDAYGGLARLADRVTLSPEAGRYAHLSFNDLHETLKSYDSSAKARQILNDPYFKERRPCTLLIDEIEAIWSAIADHDDWSKFDDKVSSIRRRAKTFGHSPQINSLTRST
jgi:serine/tyrosine/threonine adenylyltransferase